VSVPDDESKRSLRNVGNSFHDERTELHSIAVKASNFLQANFSVRYSTKAYRSYISRQEVETFLE
jgi:hypothetical protein